MNRSISRLSQTSRLRAFVLAAATFAAGINRRGQIVGAFGEASGKAHGYLLSSGAFILLDAPGATDTQAFGINQGGEIVGFSIDAAGLHHGFLAR